MQETEQQQPLTKDVTTLFTRLKQQTIAEPYPSLEQRRIWLQCLKTALLSEQAALVEALNRDYGYRSRFDSTVCDLLPAVSHIN